MIELSDHKMSDENVLMGADECEGLTTLFESAREGDLKKMQHILRQFTRISANSSDLNIPKIYTHSTQTGKTALHWAAEAGQIEVLIFLVDEAGGNINLVDLQEHTALFLAAKNAQIECVKFLLDRDVEISLSSLDFLGTLPIGRALIDNLFRAHLNKGRSFFKSFSLFLKFLDVTMQSRTALNNYVLKSIEFDLSDSDIVFMNGSGADAESKSGRTPFSRVLLHAIDWVYFLPAVLRWQATLRSLPLSSVSEAADLGIDLVERLNQVIFALFDTECMDHEVVVLQQLLLLHPNFLPTSIREVFYSSKKLANKSNIIGGDGSEAADDMHLSLSRDIVWMNRPPALYAACLANGSLLDFALKHQLKALFEITQITAIVDKVFRRNARLPLDRESQHRRRVFRWLLTLRFSPRYFFILELVSQIVMLILLWKVSVTYGHYCTTNYTTNCNRIDEWSSSEIVLSFYVFTELCYEIGLMLTGYEHKLHLLSSWVSALRSRFRDDMWNAVDAVAVLGGVIWFIFRCFTPEYFSTARVIISLLAIPQSLGMLRYFSLFKTLGELVIIIRAMVKDLLAFLVVYLVFLLGFGITFRGLFFTASAYDSNSNTFLTLFSGSLLTYDFSVFNADSSFINGLGIVLTVLFTTCTAIILLNLLIAQMWETYDRIRSQSVREWCFHYTQLVQRLSLSQEKNVFCMLPAPLNLVPIVCSVFGWRTLLAIDSKVATASPTTRSPLTASPNSPRNEPNVSKYVSVGGTAANCLLAYLFYPFAIMHRAAFVVSTQLFDASDVVGTDKQPSMPNFRNLNLLPKHTSVSDSYQRHNSDDENDGRQGISRSKEDDNVEHAKYYCHHNIIVDMLEFILQPSLLKEKKLQFSEKLYFICVTFPLLWILWPIAPFVASVLGSYPILEIIDGKDGNFVPEEYLYAATSWNTETSTSRDLTNPVNQEVIESKKESSSMMSIESKKVINGLGPRNSSTLQLRHVESSKQMLAERNRTSSQPAVLLSPRDVRVGSMPTGSYPSLDAATGSATARNDFVVSSSYFESDDADRILLPLVKSTNSVDLDALAKRSLQQAYYIATSRLEDEIKEIKSLVKQLHKSNDFMVQI